MPELWTMKHNQCYLIVSTVYMTLIRSGSWTPRIAYIVAPKGVVNYLCSRPAVGLDVLRAGQNRSTGFLKNDSLGDPEGRTIIGQSVWSVEWKKTKVGVHHTQCRETPLGTALNGEAIETLVGLRSLKM